MVEKRWISVDRNTVTQQAKKRLNLTEPAGIALR